MILDGNKLTVMLAGMYFAPGGMPLDAAVEFETRVAQQMADAVAIRHRGSVDRVYRDPKAGGWFAEITLRSTDDTLEPNNPGETIG
jgi:hypothetical protein